MTLEEFRIAHSLLIEHYQHIEFNLKGILSAINDEKLFLDGMDEAEKDTIRRVINGIKAKQKEKDIVVLSDDEYNQLKHISERRNYWCHQCYIEMVLIALPELRRKSGKLMILYVIQERRRKCVNTCLTRRFPSCGKK